MQGGAETAWTVNSNGLTQGNGTRNLAILDLKAGDAVVVVTASTISSLVNGVSTNDTYTGTCKFSVTADGAFGYAFDRNTYTTSITVYREVDYNDVASWDFTTASWAKESGFGTSTVTINNQSCTYATGDLEGLALQGGSGTAWTVNSNGLTQGNGTRNLAILDLKAGDVVTVVTASTISSLVNGTSINDTYTGTCKFSVTADGAFGYAFDRSKYTTSITVSRPYVEVSVGSTGYATFASSFPLDFTGSGLTAYIITGAEGTAVVKQEVTSVAANTPVLLEAAEGAYSVDVTTSGTDYSSTNCLKQGTGDIAYASGYSRYVLGISSSGEAEFQKLIEGSYSATVPSTKAYLEFSDTNAPSALFIENEVTGITLYKSTASGEQNEIYNLAGQRIAQPHKGLYIVNGKKVLIK